MSWHRTPAGRRTTAIAAFAVAFGAAGPAAAGTATMTFGGLAITYDAEVWQPATTGPASAALKCIAPACSRSSPYSGSPTLYLTAAPAEADPKSPCNLDLRDGEAATGYGRESRTRHQVGELAFAVTVTPSACRALSPSLIQACTVSGSTAYVFANGFGNGCRSEPDLPVTALTDLLNGVRPTATPR